SVPYHTVPCPLFHLEASYVFTRHGGQIECLAADDNFRHISPTNYDGEGSRTGNGNHLPRHQAPLKCHSTPGVPHLDPRFTARAQHENPTGGGCHTCGVHGSGCPTVG